MTSPREWRAADWIALALLAAAALGAAFVLFGHFAKPHSDFFEFWLTGAALVSGEIPESTRRAPVFPLLIALDERVLSLAPSIRLPALITAESINAALLPANGILTFLLLRAPLLRWAPAAAIWFIFLPLSFYCTAHALVEPLLLFWILLALVCVPRCPRTAYVAAALACITRYDAIGLLIGVFVVDLLAKRTPRTVILRRGFLAALPLLGWLGVSALLWRQVARGHYLTQIIERPSFSPLATLRIMHRAVFHIEHLRAPLILTPLDGPVQTVVSIVLVSMGVIGAVRVIRQRCASGIAALITLAVYLLIHSVFPFYLERFGYPTAPLWLLLIAWGFRSVADFAGRSSHVARIRQLLGPLLPAAIICGLAAAVVCGFLALEQAQAFDFTQRPDFAWARPVPFLLVAAALLIYCACRPRGTPKTTEPSAATRWMQVAGGWFALLVFLTLSLAQAREGSIDLGSGREMATVMQAADWIRGNAAPEDRVLSAVTGPLQLVCGRDQRARFVFFGDIRGQTWPEILAELRAGRIRYIIWYVELYNETAPYYEELWGLRRFAILSSSAVSGLRPATVLRGQPDVTIWEVLDE